MSAPFPFRLPKPLRHRKASLDNLTLLPASLLPQKASWQALANRLPVGATLIILPAADTSQRKTLERVARLLRAKGYQVTTRLAEQFLEARQTPEPLPF